jgi:hypothetical protein
MRRKLSAGVLTTGVTLALMASPAFGGPPANHDHYLTVPGTGAQIQVAPPICELEGTPAEDGAHGAFHNFHSNVHTGTPATQGDLTITPAFC